MIATRPTRRIRIVNRTESRWSANSFLATIRQPVARPGRVASTSGVSACAAIPSLSLVEIAAVDLVQFLAPAPQVPRRQAGLHERRGESLADVAVRGQDPEPGVAVVGIDALDARHRSQHPLD